MQIPDHEQQIVQTHAAFICQAAELILRSDGAAELGRLLDTAVQSGWSALADAVRRIAAGERNIAKLGPLDDEDRVIATAILQGIQDPSSLPDPSQKADPTLAAPGLAHMIHAAASGNAQALSLISQMAEQMSKVGGDMSRVAAVIRPLINGERNADRLCSRLDVRGQQLVTQILDELGKLERH